MPQVLWMHKLHVQRQTKKCKTSGKPLTRLPLGGHLGHFRLHQKLKVGCEALFSFLYYIAGLMSMLSSTKPICQWSNYTGHSNFLSLKRKLSKKIRICTGSVKISISYCPKLFSKDTQACGICFNKAKGFVSAFLITVVSFSLIYIL